MTMPDRYRDLALVRDDLAYHQARVLLLVTAVAAAQGHSGKVDGLTKLAKLDFLLRYPALAPSVLDRLDPADARLHLADDDRADPANAEAPMIRYKYGPWDVVATHFMVARTRKRGELLAGRVGTPMEGREFSRPRLLPGGRSPGSLVLPASGMRSRTAAGPSPTRPPGLRATP